jgi:hypothetical protein
MDQAKNSKHGSGETPAKKVDPQTNRQKALPGSQGGGDYYHINVRPKEDFMMFRYSDVGRPGHVQRLAGKKPSGTWETQSWLISKNDAHVEEEHIVPDTYDARKLLRSLGSVPQYIKGDMFEPKDRRPQKKMAERAGEQEIWWMNYW